MVSALSVRMSTKAILRFASAPGITLALALIVVIPLATPACSSTRASSTGRDGAADQTSNTPDSSPRTGGAGGATGGASGGGAGGMGSGGSTSGVVGDSGQVDGASDALIAPDAPISSDGDAGCGPGYPLNSQRPQGDGCNTCYCEGGGYWLCTTKQCPPPADAAAQVGSDAGPIPDAGCTGSGCATAHDAATDGNPMCGTRLCGSAEFCCTSPCAACMPTAASCASLVCGTADGGGYAPYPSDCFSAPSGDPTFCGVVSPTTPHSIHFYECSTSVLASPCWKVSLGTAGGFFCCPGALF
jgi:hypothetical protein